MLFKITETGQLEQNLLCFKESEAKLEAED